MGNASTVIWRYAIVSLALVVVAPAMAQDGTNVLGVVVSYADAPNVASPASWEKSLFSKATSARAFYTEGSGGAHTFTGSVIPTAVVLSQNRPAGACGTPDYNTLARAIEARGYRLADYKTLVMSAVRSLGGCGQSFASNLSYVDQETGQKRSMKFVIMWGSPTDAVLVHELLHTEGVPHANKLGCIGGVPLGPYCTSTEYGNPADIMGTAGQYQTTNAVMRAKLKWGQQVTHTVGGKATYTIGPAYTPGALPNAVVVPLGVPPGVQSFAPITLYIEYRAPLGFDARMLTKSSLNSYITGAMLNVTGAWAATTPSGRRFSAMCTYGSCLLDMTPGDNNWSNGALQVGSIWKDPFTGVTVSVDSRTDTTLTVTVETGS